MAKHNAESIANALRKRVCLEPPTASPVLHEQAIAEEFNVSRTPVRQALQRLAYERLVEVRSGIGTVVRALTNEGREEDIALAFALTDLAGEIESDRPISIEAASYIIALEQQVARTPSLDLDTNFSIRVSAIHTITNEMKNDIMADALKSALWRLFRWRLAEAADRPDGKDVRLPEVMAALRDAAQTGQLKPVLHAIGRGNTDG